MALSVLYNAALEHRRNAWKKLGKTVSAFDQFGALAEIRAQDSIYAAIAVWILRSAIARLERAFKDFFRRCKNGEKPGYPRWRNRHRYDSFDFPIRPTSIKGNRISIPNFGDVKFTRHRELTGIPKRATVRRTAKGWDVSIVCDLGHAPPLNVDINKSTGIDLGLTDFLVLADGTAIKNPRYYKKGQDLIARRQRILQTKKRGSKSRRKAVQLVAKAHMHVQNQKRDFHWKTAKWVVNNFDVIAFEDLNIRGMIEKEGGPRLARHITGTGWGGFEHCLTSKAEEAGKLAVAVNPKGTTQRCSKCQTVVPKGLADRWHVCEKCGLCIGRDQNAAINIQTLGLSAAREVLRLRDPTAEHRITGASH